MNLDTHKSDFEKSLEHTQQEINSMRTSRANPALIENIMVSAYNSKMPLNQTAGITCPESRQLLVEPWDKTILKDIEKAIETAGLGLSISNEGNYLRLNIPPMTEETRNQIIKSMHTKLETGRVSLRQLRDKIKTEIENELKNKTITEDDKFSLIKDLDETTREYTEKINEAGKKKEEEIKL